MKLDSRVAAVVGIVALVAVPAAVLRVLCIGHSCERDETADRNVPFCSLPARTRDAISAGYREGRSPDVLAVTGTGIRLTSGSADPAGAQWPSVDHPLDPVPVVFWGQRFPKGAEIDAMGLDDVAPTLARVADFAIPHPEVRSGRAVAGSAQGPRPRLLLEIVLRDVSDVASDPVLDALASRGSSADASAESLPRDPTALMTTIGTGGVPAEHGITATLVRNESARVAEAWSAPELDLRAGGRSPSPPRSIIATLADDLDEELGQRPKVALVADTYQARGLVGGNWYVDNDRDELAVVPTDRVLATLREVLARGFGRDEVTDLIGLSLRTGRTEGATAALHVLRVVEKAVGSNFAAAIVALPADPSTSTSMAAGDVGKDVNKEIGHPVVEADTAGGFFLDQEAMASSGITKETVVDAIGNTILEAYGSKTDRVFADVFPGLAVAFARFC